MVMRLRLGFTFLFCILVIPAVLALNTDVNVEGEPNTNLIIRVLASGTDNVVTSVYVKIDDEGKGYANFSSGSRTVDFLVLVVDGNKVAEEKIFRGDYNAGDSVSLSLIEEEVEINESANESMNESEEVNISGSRGITGKTVANNTGSSIPSYVYYIIGGVIFVGLIILFMIKGREFDSGWIPRKNGSRKGAQSYKEELLSTERKLKDAEEEIDSIIKREEELKEDEEEVEEREEELDEREEKLGKKD